MHGIPKIVATAILSTAANLRARSKLRPSAELPAAAATLLSLERDRAMSTIAAIIGAAFIAFLLSKFFRGLTRIKPDDKPSTGGGNDAGPIVS